MMRDDVKVATIPQRIRRNAEATHQSAGHRLARTHQVDDMMRDDVKFESLRLDKGGNRVKEYAETAVWTGARREISPKSATISQRKLNTRHATLCKYRGYFKEYLLFIKCRVSRVACLRLDVCGHFGEISRNLVQFRAIPRTSRRLQ